MAAIAILRRGCWLAVVLGLAVASKATAQVVYVDVRASYPAPMVGAYVGGYAPHPYNVYNPRRAYRQALRYGYPPLFQSWPPVPHPLYGPPYYGPGPRAVYGQPVLPQVPTPAALETRPPAPSSSTGAPSSSPELVPAPAAESGS